MLTTVINQLTDMTHMPFMPPAISGESVLLFCRMMPNLQWKLHYANGNGEVRRIETGLSDEVTECAPTAWYDDAGWHISFIAGGATNNPLFRLYQLNGPSLDNLSLTVIMQPARSGFAYRERVVWGGMKSAIWVHERGSDYEIAFPNSNIYSISYQADAPDQLLISGSNTLKNPDVDLKERQRQHENSLFVLRYNLLSGKQHFITCNGKPAYKCAILGDDIVYAERTGDHFEHRKLRKADKAVFTPTSLGQREAETTAKFSQGQAMQVDKTGSTSTLRALINVAASVTNLVTAAVGPRASAEIIEHRRKVCTACEEVDLTGQRLFRVVDNQESCGRPMDPRVPGSQLLRNPVTDGCGCWLQDKWVGKSQACPRGKWTEDLSESASHDVKRRCCGQ